MRYLILLFSLCFFSVAGFAQGGSNAPLKPIDPLKITLKCPLTVNISKHVSCGSEQEHHFHGQLVGGQYQIATCDKASKLSNNTGMVLANLGEGWVVSCDYQAEGSDRTVNVTTSGKGNVNCNDCFISGPVNKSSASGTCSGAGCVVTCYRCVP